MASVSDEFLTKMWETYCLLEKETYPDKPLTPVDQQIATWRSESTDHYRLYRWAAVEGDEVVGVAVIYLDMAQNLDNGFGRVAVHPDHRGKGIARLLAKPVFETLEKENRPRMDTWVTEGSEHAGLPERLGLKAVYISRDSGLKISDLDMDLMDTWIKKAEERASDYELRFVDSPLPDDIIEDFCKLAEVMNTAPREDYEAEDEEITPELMREYEQMVHDGKGVLHHCYAVHVPTGEFAGYTTIRTKDLEPKLGEQWDTGVNPDHRNKGLGRWLKAANIKSVLESYPEIELITTDNAGSNAPMLGINIEMGFKTLGSTEAWQGSLATARERFGI